jgi:uncharacterized protein YjbI with pentapeptide repeats
MYSNRPCSEPECGKSAFADETTCLLHVPSPGEVLGRWSRYLSDNTEIRNLNLSGATFAGLKLDGKSFICCSFMAAELEGMLFTGSRLRLCFFDRAELRSCDFSRADIQFSSFGCAKIQNSSFESSELLHVNFSGARIEECTFDNSNLYDSRFIRTELITTDFVDCDLKRVHLIPATEVGVSYRYSNTMEAIRDVEHLYQ